MNTPPEINVNALSPSSPGIGWLAEDPKKQAQVLAFLGMGIVDIASVLDLSPCEVSELLNTGLHAYSAEDDRLFRRNVTGDSAASTLVMFSTRIGHVQSRF